MARTSADVESSLLPEPRTGSPAPADGFAPGELVGGRYRLQQVVGRGGMATVWRACDERLRRPVAVKLMSARLTDDLAAVKRFAREARMQRLLQHPNLVRVHDHSLTAPRPYLVMELIAGTNLSERLDHGGLTPSQLRALARQLLSAVAAIHDRGLLHRDIKPGNVLLDDGNNARLIDLGLAHCERSSTGAQRGPVLGTLRFLAPELLQGRPASRQSDLYALGVLLRTAMGARPALAEVHTLIASLTRQAPHGRPHDATEALALLDRR